MEDDADQAVVRRHVVRREESKQTNILLFMLLLLFLCMIALAVALCRMERVERTLDTMTVLMHRPTTTPIQVPVVQGPMMRGGNSPYLSPPFSPPDAYYTRSYYHPR